MRDGSPAVTTQALWSWTAVILAFLYLPLVVVAIYSFNDDRFLLLWSGVGVAGYRDALANTVVRQAFANSLIVASGTAAVAVVVGGLAGVALAHGRGAWRAPFSVVLGLVLVAPEVVVGLAYLITFVALGVTSGLFRLLISHSVLATALVTMVVRARAERLDPTLEEAAADLGATPTAVFRDITLPLLRPALLAGACLAFTFSLDDVVMSAFVSTAGSVTLPVYVFSALRTGLKTEHAAASMMALVITLAIGGLGWRAARALVALDRERGSGTRQG